MTPHRSPAHIPVLHPSSARAPTRRRVRTPTRLPTPTPADTIVIRDKTPRALKPATAAQVAGPSPNPVRAMKALLVAMASDRVPPDVRVEETHRSVPLWIEARFSLVRQYEGRGLIGEKYLLQNVSNAPMVLAEPEFDREAGRVAGVSIEQHNLRPGESTSVYVIRRGEAP